MNDGSRLVQDFFGFESQWLSTRSGERIHYLDEGPSDGRPVVLLHGSAIGISAIANFYLTIPALTAAGYRVIAPDLYGYGLTEEPPGVDAMRPHQVDLVIRICDQLGLDRPHLVGNSLGGMVLTSVAIQHPNRVRGGVVIGTGGARWDGGPRFESNTSSVWVKDTSDESVVRRSMEHLVHNPANIPEELVTFRTLLMERDGALERHQRSTEQRERSKKEYPFDRAAAGSCDVPMLFVFGREDRVNPPEDAMAGAEAFPNSDLVVLGHCGHWTMVERYEEFNHLMLRFLDGWDHRIVSPPPLPRGIHRRDLGL